MERLWFYCFTLEATPEKKGNSANELRSVVIGGGSWLLPCWQLVSGEIYTVVSGNSCDLCECVSVYYLMLTFDYNEEDFCVFVFHEETSFHFPNFFQFTS